MTITLSTTQALLDLMPGRAGRRKAQGGVAVHPGLRLLPGALRDALIRRARQRELETAFERLGETSAHLLADIGVAVAGDGEAEAPPRLAWTRGLPPAATRAVKGPPRPSGAPAASRSRGRAPEEARRQAWSGPDHWLR